MYVAGSLDKKIILFLLLQSEKPQNCLVHISWCMCRLTSFIGFTQLSIAWGQGYTGTSFAVSKNVLACLLSYALLVVCFVMKCQSIRHLGWPE